MQFLRVDFIAALLQDLLGSYFWQGLVFVHNPSAQFDSDAQFGRVFFRINCRTLPVFDGNGIVVYACKTDMEDALTRSMSELLVCKESFYFHTWAELLDKDKFLSRDVKDDYNNTAL